jgi:hypothetical protein
VTRNWKVKNAEDSWTSKSVHCCFRHLSPSKTYIILTPRVFNTTLITWISTTHSSLINTL